MVAMTLAPFSMRLKTSNRVTIREVTPSDAKLLQDGFEKLSDQSRTFRSLAAHPRLSRREIEMFTAPNDDDHFAIGAVLALQDPPQPVGIGRYIRLQSNGSLVEFALTIIDTFHGHGLGGLMLGVLAKHAVHNGISAFTALVHEGNDRMLNLLEDLRALAVTPDERETEFRMTLHSDASQYPDTPAGDAFRMAFRFARVH